MPARRGTGWGSEASSVSTRTTSLPEVFGVRAADPALRLPGLREGAGRGGLLWDQCGACAILLTSFYCLPYAALIWGEAAGNDFEVIIKISTCLRQTIVG